MPEVLSEKPVPYDVIPNRIRWTVKQCDALRDAGYLTQRYELIDGEIISKMGQKPAHARRVNLFMAWLVRVFGADFVRVQSAIDIAELEAAYDEPEPDAVVTRSPESAYELRHPTPDQILLLVEVSDSTARFDRSTKAALYSRAGIQEYWVADVGARRIYVHRLPVRACYSDIRAYEADESVAPLASPYSSVIVGSLLPPTT
jgi:Uma2 family endonuclease